MSATKRDLQVRVSTRQSGSKQWYEATVNINGLRPTLLTKTDGSTQFTTRSSLTGVARNLAKTLGYSGVVEPQKVAAKASSTKTATKKTAAKKTATKKSSKKNS